MADKKPKPSKPITDENGDRLDGRPTKYERKFNRIATRMCLLGATDKELAEAFNVSVVTLFTWRKQHPSFLKAVYNGREGADEKVAASLYKRACGMSIPAVKIFNNGVEKITFNGEKIEKNADPLIVPYKEHLPPDVGAQTLWLKNRQPAKWREKTDLTIGNPDGTPLAAPFVVALTADELPKPKLAPAPATTNETTAEEQQANGEAGQ